MTVVVPRGSDRSNFFFVSLFIFLTFFTCCLSTFGVYKPCMGRDFGGGSQVCVCNSSYCDTVEPWLPMSQSRGRYVLYSTSKAGLRLERTIGRLQTKDNRTDDGVEFVIHPERRYQSIIGFGAAFTDAAGYNIVNLSEGSRDHLLRSYYGTEGIELNMGRVPIGCSQFSLRGYSYADVPGDLYLKHFALQPEDYVLKLPLIKKVNDITNGKLKLIGTPWTAPFWMKTNKNITGFGMLRVEYYQVWADYFVRFLKEYRMQGVEFWGISTQNRPSKGLVESELSPSMGWTSRSMSQFISKYLGPTLRESPYKKLMVITVDDNRYLIPWTLYAMFKMSGTNNNETKKFINGVGVQWYMDSLVPSENLDLCHELYPDLFIITTEAATGASPGVLEVNDLLNHKVRLGSWERAEQYAENMLENLNHWVSGWLDWNIALDTGGGPCWHSSVATDANIIINLTTDEFYKQPQFYAFGHFSKFISEGSVRIYVETETQSVLHVAFLAPDNSTIVILYNPHDEIIPVEVKTPASDKTIAFNFCAIWRLGLPTQAARILLQSAKENNDRIMSDVKSVIALLCKHLYLSIDCTLKPEYFRLAKYNKADDNVTNALWTVLYVLSREVVKDIRAEIDFDRYADFHATKLYFAFLQYPAIEFYLLSPKNNSRNRELLLAMGWLFAKKDALNTAIRSKLTTSILSHEFTRIEDSPEKATNNVLSDDAISQMRGIVHACGRISHNVKEIAELTREKMKLTAKIHGATLNASGLPHLSVSQLALTKNSSIKGDSNFSKKEKEFRKELHSLAEILATHEQWNKCQGVFYDWMVTVIEENKNDKTNNETSADQCDELSNFLSLLRHVTKKKLHSIKSNEKAESREVTPYEETCCSLLIRTQRQSNEMESWNRKTIERLNIVEGDVEIKMNDLTSELRKMLRLIPNCVEI